MGGKDNEVKATAIDLYLTMRAGAATQHTPPPPITS
jgi:hypothetical protein